MGKASEKVYGNSATKVVHAKTRNDQCRASEIEPKNLVWFPNLQAALDQDYVMCITCYPPDET